MAGTSNLGSWVSTQTASRGPRAAPTSARYLSGQATTTSSAIGNRARVANTGPGVADRDPVAEDLGHLGQGGGEVDGAEDDHAGRRGERLDEDRHVPAPGLAVPAVVAGDGQPGGQLALERRGPTTRSRSGSPSCRAPASGGPGEHEQLAAQQLVWAFDDLGQGGRLLGPDGLGQSVEEARSPVEGLHEDPDGAAAGQARRRRPRRRSSRRCTAGAGRPRRAPPGPR